jgi:hypothetical protein
VPLKISRRSAEGITVPYAPIFDAVRKNRGFKDVRGRPDLAAEIAEGIESRALGECLVRIAKENLCFSLGCDLGNHHEPEQPAPLGQVAGGYIQVTSINYASATTDQLDAFSLAFGSRLKRLSRSHSWSIDLVGTWVNFVLPGEPAARAPSMWIWFFAAARTHSNADASREVLIGAISETLHAPAVSKCLLLGCLE